MNLDTLRYIIIENDRRQGDDDVPLWQDECKASITAAKITPNLTQTERHDFMRGM